MQIHEDVDHINIERSDIKHPRKRKNKQVDGTHIRSPQIGGWGEVMMTGKTGGNISSDGPLSLGEDRDNDNNDDNDNRLRICSYID